MSEISTIYKTWTLINQQDQFLSSIMNELEEWENKVGAKEIASTIKWLMKAKTLNAKWDEMDDNKARLDAVKLVLQLNWIKTNQTNINIFNIQKPWKDDNLIY